MNLYSVKRVSGPSQEPVTVAQAKTHCNVSHSDDDILFSALVSAAREACEDETGRCFTWSTYELRLDAFPKEIRLPRPPLIRVNSIRYVDEDGVTQTLGSDNWQLDDSSEPARIRPAYEMSWPATRRQMNAVTVSYVSGYPIDEAGSPADYAVNVPPTIIQAIKITIAHLYVNREPVNVGNIVNEIPMSAKWLLAKHRVWDANLTA